MGASARVEASCMTKTDVIYTYGRESTARDMSIEEDGRSKVFVHLVVAKAPPK